MGESSTAPAPRPGRGGWTDDRICAICLGDFYVRFYEETDQVIVRTSCGHEYDDHCIQEWRRISPTCPSCRRPLGADDVTDITYDVGNDYVWRQQLNPESVEAAVRTEADLRDALAPARTVSAAQGQSWAGYLITLGIWVRDQDVLGGGWRDYFPGSGSESDGGDQEIDWGDDDPDDWGDDDLGL